MSEEFEKELEFLINRYSKENKSNTPDFILAKYLLQCLKAFEGASNAREKWYGKEELIIYSWTHKSKYVCPSCQKKAVNSDGDCQKCDKKYQLKMDMVS